MSNGTTEQNKNDRRNLLNTTSELANEFLDGVAERAVARPVDFEKLLAELNGAGLQHEGDDPKQIVSQLARLAEHAIVATAGPRYFGFVVGGSLPIALATDWLTSAWDQNGAFFAHSPLAAAVEKIAGDWLIDLFGLSKDSSVGFVTGGTMGNFTGLAAGRHALLQELGWDVEKQGLIGAPKITVVASEESHVSVFACLQMLGLGSERVVRVPADGQGRMSADQLRSILAGIETPVLVCAQAGNVNTGSFDPIPEIVSLIHDRPSWLHVDGAFGLWAGASGAHRSLVQGIELADSVSVDCHKWLNVPYDSGIAFVRDAAAHRAAMTLHASYYVTAHSAERDNCDWVPEASRRARGFTVYAALRFLGRKGIEELIDRCCRLARRMADRLAKDPAVSVLNNVVLNQVLVRFSDSSGSGSDEFTAEVIRRVQEEGTCWLGGTTWRGMRAMRISISNWSTTERDIDLSADAILRCAAGAAAGT
ncbi:MAG TPA: aminotransferase class V-fold PLP-dependent enzyme [Pyrinomonadaceae bacterium]|jgi:glutamate/tyrosine decarboxylase-like PLP-dependent enzyme|nr:aminotransferase class V-fold PLP-dependent enzyme [Pyrinomonadaceae bacterium]